MAIGEGGRVRTHQIRSIHAVHRVDDTVKGGTEIADVPHPAEHWCDVNVARAKAEYGKENGQYGANENGNLKMKKKKN